MSWNDPSWMEAALWYRAHRPAKRKLTPEEDEHRQFLIGLIDSKVSIDSAYAQINDRAEARRQKELQQEKKQ